MSNGLLDCVANGAITKGTYVKVVGIVRGRPEISVATVGTVVGAEAIIGVAAETVATTESVRVQPLDGTKIGYLVAGGALTPGTDVHITSDAAGKAVAAGAGDKSLGQFVCSADSNSTDGTAAANDHIIAYLHNASY